MGITEENIAWEAVMQQRRMLEKSRGDSDHHNNSDDSRQKQPRQPKSSAMQVKAKTSKTNNLLSAQKVRACLRIAILVLVPFYLSTIWRIRHLERMQSTENDINGLSIPFNMTSSSLQEVRTIWPLSGNCALFSTFTLLYYIMTPSLLWNAAIIWRKGHRRNLYVALLSIITLLVIDIAFSGSVYDCKIMTGEGKDDTSIIARNDGTSWSNSYSPNQFMEDNVRISFRLHHSHPSTTSGDDDAPLRPEKFAGVPGYKCSSSDFGDLPPSLSNRTILNFTTSIATNLKVIFIGDSISEQFAQAFDASVLGRGYEGNRWAKTYVNGRDGMNLHNCLSASAPVRGGGASAFWRVATLMSASSRTPRPDVCEHKSRTWNENQALTLLDHRYSSSDHAKKELDHRNVTVTAFDAVVMRLNHGWLKIEEIKKERIEEAIKLSNKFLGAQTIIISTLPLNNNVVTPSDWEGVAKINQMVRDIARNWGESTRQPSDVKWILVQEFGNFTNQVVRTNAKHVKLINDTATLPDFSQQGWELAGAGYLTKRLSAATYWYPSTAMVCAERTFERLNEKNETVEDCVRNKISRDGAHWCVENMGARYSASVACLLGCVHNGKGPSADDVQDVEMVRRCEQSCNERFMSILPVEEEWIESQKMALFSKSV